MANVVIIFVFLAFWLFVMSPVLFRDDVLLWDAMLTKLPNSFFDFFNANSDYFKAWPVSASIIWLIWKMGLAKLWVYKCFCLALHLLNYFSLQRLIRKNNFGLGLLLLIHPALYLTLSWAYQFTTLLSITFALLGWACIEKMTHELKLKWLFLSTFYFALSILTKPWAVALVPLSALFLVVSYTPQQRALKSLKSIFTFCIIVFAGIFAWRTWTLSAVGMKTFVYESQAIREFESGARQPNRPLVFPIVAAPDVELSWGEHALRRSVYMANTATVYSGMTIGVGTLGACYPRPDHADYKIVIGLLIFSLGLLLSIVLTMEKFKAEQVRRFTEQEWRLWVRALVWLFAAWLPVSGIVYIPQMKFSFMSPHYIAAFIPGFIFLVQALLVYFTSRKIISVQYIKISLFLILIFFGVRHISLYWKLNRETLPPELINCMKVNAASQTIIE